MDSRVVVAARPKTALPPELRLIAGLKRASALAAGVPPVPTGWRQLDRAIGGGLPGGRMTEIVAPLGGKTSLLMSLAAEATAAGRNVGWIDPRAALDVRGAEDAGVVLDRVLWVRPATMAQAFRAADLVLGSEGFAVAILDLVGGGAGGPGWTRRGTSRRTAADDRVLLDTTAWNRLSRRAEACRVAIAVCTERPMAGATAALGLDVRLSRPDWVRQHPDAPLTLAGAAVEVSVRHRKGGQDGFVGCFPCEVGECWPW